MGEGFLTFNLDDLTIRFEGMATEDPDVRNSQFQDLEIDMDVSREGIVGGCSRWAYTLEHQTHRQEAPRHAKCPGSGRSSAGRFGISCNHCIVASHNAFSIYNITS